MITREQQPDDRSTPSILSDTVVMETAARYLSVRQRRRKVRRVSLATVFLFACCCACLLFMRKTQPAEPDRWLGADNAISLYECPEMSVLRSSLNDLESGVQGIADDDDELRNLAATAYPITFGYVSKEESL